MTELVNNGNFGLPDISGATFQYSAPTSWTKTGTAYLTNTGYSLTFNGANHTTYVNPATTYAYTSGTIECRFRTTAVNSGNQGLMVKRNAYGIYLVNNILSASGMTTPNLYSGAVNDGYWHQAVFVFQSGVVNGSKLFLDGKLINTFTHYTISDQQYSLNIGSSGGYEFFNGSIYEARVWNVVLSDATIALQNNKAINPATQPNLVGYWPLTEGSGSTMVNSVASQPSLASSFTPIWTFLGTIGMADLYEGGYALTFNGTNQYAIVPLATDYSTITSGTIECRFRTTAVNSGVQSLFMKTRAFGIFLNNNILSVYTWGGTPGWVAGVYSGSVNDGNWHQVVFTFQSGVASGSKLFLDGILVTSAFTYTIADQVGKLSIGASHDGTTIQQYFNGSIYEVRIWNVVLADATIALYNNKPIDPATQTNFVGYWSFAEGSGTTAANSITGYPSLTLVNAPVWTQLGKAGVVDLFEGGYGLAFNGSTQYGILAATGSYAYPSGTIECRFRTTSTSGALVSKGSAYALFVGTNSIYVFDWGGIINGVFSTSVPANDGNWHHAAFSFQSGVTNGSKLYFDGAVVGTFNYTISNQTGKLAIGATYDSYYRDYFNGSIEEVRVWSTVLSDATIFQNYNKPIDPTLPNLTGYWPLNENVGAIAYNSIPGGPNFTLTASPVWVKVAKTPSLFHHRNLPSTFQQFAYITNISTSLTQTVIFPKAGNYTLSFWTTYNTTYYNASTTLSVSIGTLSTTSIAYTSNNWVQYLIPFSVTSSQLTQTLELKETTITGTQIWITGVSIVATTTASTTVAVPVVVNFAAANKARYNFFNSAKYTDIGNLLGKKYTLQYETYTKNKQTLLFPTKQEVRPAGLSYSGQVSNGETFTFGPSQDFRMVACGQGTGNTLAYSSNGIQWAGIGKTVFTSSGNAIAWNGAAWLGAGSGGNALAYSLDGIVWTGLGTGTFTLASSVTWNGTLWVLTGGGSGNTLAYSYCGLAFGGLGTSIFDTAGYTSAYSGTIWVAGGAGTGNTLAYSSDGVLWRGLGKRVFTTTCFNVCWNGTIWVGAGNGGNTLSYSYDGLNWTGLGSGLFTTAGNRVEWNGSVFVAGGEGGNTLAYSLDGVNWTPLGANTFTTRCQSVKWNGSVFLTGGVGGNTMAYSADGISWTGIGSEMFNTTTLGFSTNNVRQHRMTVSPSMSVAVGSGTGNTIAYSMDGLSWNGMGMSIFNEGISVTWNGSIWMATGVGGNTLAYSNDGIQWTGLGLTIFDSIGWMAKWNGTIWVAVGQGSVNTLAYSTNGIVWKGLGKTIFDDFGASVAWNGTRWVAIGNGTQNTIAYSSDGIQWTGIGKSIFNYGYGLAWNGTMFVATSSNGGNTLAYSYNGIDWTGLGNNVFGSSGYGVAWNGSVWIATGYIGNTIAYSYNGIQWTGLGYTVFSAYGIGVSWNGTMWIAAGGDGNPGNTLAYSYDGINWAGSGGTIFNYYGNEVESKTSSSASVFIQHPTLAVGTGGGNTIVYSAEGLYWKGLGKQIFDVAGTGVVWNGSIWVATGSGSKNSLGFSTDGLAWTGLGKSVFTSSANELAWSGTAWVAGGMGGNVLAGNVLGYSKDGINWTGLGSAFMTSVNTVAWNGQYWLAGGYDIPTSDMIDPYLYMQFTMDVRTTRGIYLKNSRVDVGNTYSGVLSGKSEVVGTPTINTTDYKVGTGSLAFDVSGQYVAVTAGLNTDANGLTFAFWMRGNNSVGNYTVFDFAGGLGANNSIRYGLQNNTVFTQVVSNSTVGSISFTPLSSAGRFSSNTFNNDMAMSNDGTMIVFGGNDSYSNARNFYYRRGMDATDVSINFTGKTTGINIVCMAITGDGKRLVYAYDTTVAYLTWSDASQNFINPVTISSSVPNAFGMDMTEDGSTIVLACGGYASPGRVPLWSTWTGSSYTSFSTLNTNIPVSNSVTAPYYFWTACGITADGSRVAYGSQDQNTVFYILKKGETYQNTIQSFTIGGGGAWRVRFSKDGNVLFIGTNGGGVYYSLWNGTSYGNTTQIIPNSVNYGSSIIYISVGNLVVDYNNNVYFGAVRSFWSKDIKKTTFSLSNVYNQSNIYAIQSAYPNLNDNNWRHFAWTIDPVTKTYSHYINGSLMSVDSSSGYVFPQTGFNRTSNFLGVANDLSLSYFMGRLDDFRVYKRVLRPLEVQSLMSTHHYTMDVSSVSGTNLGNYAMKYYDSVLSGSVIPTVNATNYAIGSGALAFDVCGQYVNINSGLASDANGLSFAFWMRGNSSIGNNTVLDFGGGTGGTDRITWGLRNNTVFTQVVSNEKVGVITYLGGGPIIGFGTQFLSVPNIILNGNGMIVANGSTAYYTKNINGSWTSVYSIFSYYAMQLLSVTADGKRMVWIGDTVSSVYYTTWNGTSWGPVLSSLTGAGGTRISHSLMSADGNRFFMNTSAGLRFGTWDGSNYGGWAGVTGTNGDRRPFCITPDANKIFYSDGGTYCYYATWNPTLNNYNSGILVDSNTLGSGGMACSPDGYIVCINTNVYLWNNNTQKYQIALTTGPVLTVGSSMQMTEGFYSSSPGVFYIFMGNNNYGVTRYTYSISNFYYSSSNFITNAYNLNDNVWRHFVWTIDPANKTYKQYINGQLILTDTSPSYVFPQVGYNHTNNRIGGAADVSMSYFLGGIDDFRVYKKVLSSADIFPLILQSPPAFHYTMDSVSSSGLNLGNYATGTLIYDASLNGNSVVTGAPTIGRTDYTIGATALAFSVSGQFVSINAGLTSDLNGLSFAFWMRGNNSVGNYTVLDFAGGAGGNNKITYGLQNNTVYTQVTSNVNVGALSFTTPANVIDISGTGSHGICMTGDGKRFIIANYNAGTIKTYTYSGSSWVLFNTLEGQANLTGVCCTADGNRIAFTRRSYGVYFATWNSGTSSYIVNDTAISTILSTGGSSMTPDGRVLLFSTGVSATPNDKVYYSFWNGSTYTTPSPVSGSSILSYRATSITPDGSRIAYIDYGTKTVYSGYWNGSQYVQDTNSVGVTSTVNPAAICFSPDGNILLVMNAYATTNFFYSIFNGTSYGALTYSGVDFSVGNPTGTIILYDNTIYSCSWTASGTNAYIQKSTFTASNSYLKSNFSAIQTAFPTLNDNAWRHFAWTIDPVNKTYKHYINGTLLVTDVSTAYVFPQVGFNRTKNLLGVSNDLSMSYFVGGLDDFRVYKKVLSAAEISTLTTLSNNRPTNYYTQTTDNYTSVLLYVQSPMYYTFNAGSTNGLTLMNNITSVYDATLTGNTAGVGTPTINNSNYALGTGSLSFDVTGQFVILSSGLSSDGYGLSFAFWMRGNNLVGNSTVFDFAVGAGGNHKITYGLQSNTVYTQVTKLANVGTLTFTAPANVPDISGTGIYGICMSNDGKRFITVDYTAGTLKTFVYSGSSWVLVNTISSLGNLTGVCCTGDGSRIVYTVRGTGLGAYFATWNSTTSSYSAPSNITTMALTASPSMTPDGRVLIFSNGFPTTTGYVYYSFWTGSGYTTPAQVTSCPLEIYFGTDITQDGSRIAYSSYNSRNIYSGYWNGSTYVHNTTAVGNVIDVFQVRFSPDGNILFALIAVTTANLYYSVFTGSIYGGLTSSAQIFTNFGAGLAVGLLVGYDNSVYAAGHGAGTTNQYIQKVTFTASASYLKSNFPAIQSAHPNLNDNKWRHFAWTIDPATSTYKHYINGILLVSDTSTAYTFPLVGTNRGQNRLGIASDLSMSYFLGGLDDFRVYKKVLTADEIDALITPVTSIQTISYNGIPANNYYTFDIGSTQGNNLINSGTSVYDASLNGNSVAVGTPTISTSSYVVGNGSLAFNVTGQFVAINSGLTSDANGLTFAFWMRGNNSIGNYTVLDFAGGAGGNNSIKYGLQSNTVYTQVTGNTTVGSLSFTTPANVPDLSGAGTHGMCMTNDGKRFLIADYNSFTIKTYVYSGSLWVLVHTLAVANNVTGVCSTNDGSRIVFTVRSLYVYYATWNSATSSYTINPTTITNMTNTASPSMTPDGRILIFANQSNFVYYSFWTGSGYTTPTQVTNCTNAAKFGTDITQDGSRIAYVDTAGSGVLRTGYWNGSVYIQDTTAVTNAASPPTNLFQVRFSPDGNILFVLYGVTTNNLFYSVFNGTSYGTLTDSGKIFTNVALQSASGIIVGYDNSIYASGYSIAGSNNYIQKLTLTTSTSYIKSNFPAITSAYSTLNDNQWRHFAWTIDPATFTYKHYINGTLLVTDVSTGYTFPQIGFNRTQNRLGIANDLSMSYFVGGLGDFRVYKKVLTATEIMNLITSLTSTPVVNYSTPINYYYTFDVGSVSGTNLKNDLTNVFDASLNGNSVAVGTPTISTSSYALGNGSLAFDVAGQFVSINSGLTSDANGLSFVFWMRGNNSIGNYTVMDFAGGAGGNNCIRYGLQNNTVYTQVTSNVNVGALSFTTPVTLANISGNGTYGMCMTSDGKRFLIVDIDAASLRTFVYSGSAWGLVHTLTGQTSITGVCCNADGSRIVLTRRDAGVFYGTWSSTTSSYTLYGTAISTITTTAFPSMTPDGRVLLITHGQHPTDGIMKYSFWNGITYTNPVDVTNCATGRYWGNDITKDGSRIVYLNSVTGVIYSGYWNGSVYIQNTGTIGTSGGQLRFSPDGNILFTGGNSYYIYDGTNYGAAQNSGITLGASTGMIVGYDNSLYGAAYAVSTVKSAKFTASNLYSNTNFPAITSAYSTLNDNVWRHFAWTIDPVNKTYKHYINGALMVTDVSTAYVFPQVGFNRTKNLLGVANDLSMSYFAGGLDDFCVYRRVLTANEIMIIMSSSNSQPFQSAQVNYNTPVNYYYSFNAGSTIRNNLKNDGTSVYDASLNGSPVNVGTPTINTINYAVGNGSLAFDVSGQYVSINTGLMNDSNGLSFAFWMRGNNLCGNNTVFDFAGGAGGNNKITYSLQGNTVYTQVTNTTSIGTVTVGTPVNAFDISFSGVNGIAMSYDTKILLVTDYNNGNIKRYINTNSKLTLQSTLTGQTNVSGICCTADGNRIVFTRNTGVYFATWNAGTSTYINTTLIYSSGSTFSPNMTPDGGIIVFLSGSNYYTFWNGSSYNTPPSSVYGIGTDNYGAVDIKPDGSRMVYSTKWASAGLYGATWDGSKFVHTGIISGGSVIQRTKYSQDGNILFYMQNGNNLTGASNIMVFSNITSGTSPAGLIFTYDNNVYAADYTAAATFKFIQKAAFTVSNLYTNANFPAILSTYPNLNDNTWRHFAWTIDGSSSLVTYKHYINGSLIATDASNGYVFPQVGFNRTKNFLGVANDLSMSYFMGGLDDFRIYNRVLTTTEITNLSLISPTLYYTFDAGSIGGNNVGNYASSVLVFDASLNGNSVAVGTPIISTVDKRVGSGSLAFTVSGQFMSINSGLTTDTNGLSFAFWMRGNNSMGNYTVFDFAGGPGDNNSIQYGIQSNTLYTQVISDSSLGTVSFGSPTTLSFLPTIPAGSTASLNIAVSADETTMIYANPIDLSLSFVKYADGAWGTPVRITGLTLSTPYRVFGSVAVTGDASRIVYVSDKSLYFATWTNFNNGINGIYTNITALPSFPVTPPASCFVSAIDMTTDGSILVASILDATGTNTNGAIYFARWTGSTYSSFTAITTPDAASLKSYYGVCITADGNRIFYNQGYSVTNQNVYYANWNGTTYTTFATPIATFTSGNNYLRSVRCTADGNIVFLSNFQGSNALQYFVWNGTNYGTVQNVPTAAIPYTGGSPYSFQYAVTPNNSLYINVCSSSATSNSYKTSFFGSNMYTLTNMPGIQSAYTTLNDSIWRHFVWTIDPVNKTYKHYVNGSLDVVDVSTGYVFPKTGFNRTKNFLGVGNDLSMSYFLGGLDDFRVYKRVITDGEVTALYNLYTPIPSLTDANVASIYSNDTVKNSYVLGINRQVYSSDGLEWYDSNTSAVLDSPPNHFAWNGTLWVAAGKGGNTLSYSSDNQSWTGIGSSTFTTEALGIAWNSLFVAVGTGGNTIAYSQNGLSWTGLGTSVFSTSGTSVAWNGTRWVATGSGGNTMAYSSDGKTWIGTNMGVLTGGIAVGTNYTQGQMNSSVISNVSSLDVISDSYSGSYANASVGVETFPTG